MEIYIGDDVDVFITVFVSIAILASILTPLIWYLTHQRRPFVVSYSSRSLAAEFSQLHGPDIKTD